MQAQHCALSTSLPLYVAHNSSTTRTPNQPGVLVQHARWRGGEDGGARHHDLIGDDTTPSVSSRKDDKGKEREKGERGSHDPLVPRALTSQSFRITTTCARAVRKKGGEKEYKKAKARCGGGKRQQSKTWGARGVCRSSHIARSPVMAVRHQPLALVGGRGVVGVGVCGGAPTSISQQRKGAPLG